MKNIVVLTLLCLTFVSARAQDAVPMDILRRTILIRIGNESGTAFAIEHQGKIFLVTARHVVAGLSEPNTIQVEQAEKWHDYHIVKVLYPPSNDADIAVLETNEQATAFEIPLMKDGEGGPTMGQQVWFLGYPFGIHSRIPGGKTHEVPFIKRGTMSAVDGSNPDAVLLYIDGFNNPGFSGGPIVYWDFSLRAYRIVGVVKGYREDTAKILVNGQHVDTQLLVNSGILVGYSIQHVLQALEQKP